MKNSFSKILACVDDSKFTEKVITNAISLAEKYDSKLYVIYVIEKNTIDFWDNSKYVGIISESLIKRRENIEKMIEKKIKKFTKKINYSIFILEGHISNQIIRFSKKNSVDLIIVGNRGLGEFSKIFLGSVSNKLVNQSICSILIVK